MCFTSSQAKNAAAVGLPVETKLLRHGDGADKTVLFPEDPRKPPEAEGAGRFLPDGVDECGVLVGADGQGGAEPLDPLPDGRPGRSLELEPETEGAPLPSFRFRSKGRGRLHPRRDEKILHYDRHSPCRKGAEGSLTFFFFSCRVDIGTVPVERHGIPLFRKIGEGHRGVRGAACVEKKPMLHGTAIFPAGTRRLSPGIPRRAPWRR